VARRAMHLHGWLRLASLCPPFVLQWGYPRERISYGSGAPPLLRRLRRTLPLRIFRAAFPNGYRIYELIVAAGRTGTPWRRRYSFASPTVCSP
jgi:hypothetical protein